MAHDDIWHMMIYGTWWYMTHDICGLHVKQLWAEGELEKVTHPLRTPLELHNENLHQREEVAGYLDLQLHNNQCSPKRPINIILLASHTPSCWRLIQRSCTLDDGWYAKLAAVANIYWVLWCVEWSSETNCRLTMQLTEHISGLWEPIVSALLYMENGHWTLASFLFF